MEELNLMDLFKYYAKKWLLFLITIELTFVLGLSYIWFIKTPLYNGTTTIILANENENSNNMNNLTQSQLSMNEQLVSTYSHIIKSRTVLEQVIETLGLDVSYEQLKKQISVSSVADTSIITISVSDPSAKDAAIIANELATVFKKEIVKIYALENVAIIDKAIIEDEPYNINYIKELIIYEMVANVLLAGVIFVIYYFDNTVKTAKDIEERFGLPVLGEIPAIKYDEEEEKQQKKDEKKKKRLEKYKIDDDKEEKVSTEEKKVTVGKEIKENKEGK